MLPSKLPCACVIDTDLFMPVVCTQMCRKTGAVPYFSLFMWLPADFKQVLGQRGSKGPAPPSKLTAHQTQIVKALIEAHADDVQVYSTTCTQCRPSGVCTLSVR